MSSQSHVDRRPGPLTILQLIYPCLSRRLLPVVINSILDTRAGKRTLVDSLIRNFFASAGPEIAKRGFSAKRVLTGPVYRIKGSQLIIGFSTSRDRASLFRPFNRTVTDRQDPKRIKPSSLLHVRSTTVRIRQKAKKENARDSKRMQSVVDTVKHTVMGTQQHSKRSPPVGDLNKANIA